MDHGSNYDWKCFNDSVPDAVIRWEDLIDNYCWGMMVGGWSFVDGINI